MGLLGDRKLQWTMNHFRKQEVILCHQFLQCFAATGTWTTSKLPVGISSWGVVSSFTFLLKEENMTEWVCWREHTFFVLLQWRVCSRHFMFELRFHTVKSSCTLKQHHTWVLTCQYRKSEKMSRNTDGSLSLFQPFLVIRLLKWIHSLDLKLRIYCCQNCSWIFLADLGWPLCKVNAEDRVLSLPQRRLCTGNRDITAGMENNK